MMSTIHYEALVAKKELLCYLCSVLAIYTMQAGVQRHICFSCLLEDLHSATEFCKVVNKCKVALQSHTPFSYLFQVSREKLLRHRSKYLGNRLYLHYQVFSHEGSSSAEQHKKIALGFGIFFFFSWARRTVFLKVLKTTIFFANCYTA